MQDIDFVAVYLHTSSLKYYFEITNCILPGSAAFWISP